MNRFSAFHPLSIFLYLLSLIVFLMFIGNPVVLLMAFLSGFFTVQINREIRITKKEIMGLLVMFLLITFTNPLFVHKGETVLFFLNNNPITVESLIYGINIGLMILSVIFWFKVFNFIITDDKILFLFGKISPKIALILSTSLRFIPLLKRKSNEIRNAQKTMGLYSTDTFINNIKSNLNIISSLVTWGFENAINIGTSMKCRGYGENKATQYSPYSWKTKDTILIFIVALLNFNIIFMNYKNAMSFNFYPNIEFEFVGAYSVIGYLSFFVLSIIPIIFNMWEGLRWKYYKSKI